MLIVSAIMNHCPSSEPIGRKDAAHDQVGGAQMSGGGGRGEGEGGAGLEVGGAVAGEEWEQGLVLQDTPIRGVGVANTSLRSSAGQAAAKPLTSIPLSSGGQLYIVPCPVDQHAAGSDSCDVHVPELTSRPNVNLCCNFPS